MSDTSVNGYTVRLTQTEGLGSPWIVRVFRNRFLFKKSLSSDWFLDGVQAQKYAEEISSDLATGKGTDNLRARKPGWTLRRAAH